MRELGMVTEPEGDGLRGSSEITSHMWVPGTDVVRLSVLATWTDIIMGVLAGLATQPRVCITLDLDVHLLRLPHGAGVVHGTGSVIKRGRSVHATRSELVLEGDTTPFAVSVATFMESPNPVHVMPDLDGRVTGRLPLTMPLAQRADVRVLEPGVAVVAHHVENLNATDAIQGGIVALCAEEAALSLAPGHVLSSMALRYHRAFRTGTARATATRSDRLALVEMTGAEDGRLGVSANAHYTPLAG